MTETITVPDGSSLAGVDALVKTHTERAFTFRVHNQSDNEQAGVLRKWLGSTLDAIEAQRKAESDPLHKAWRENNARYKPLTDALSKAYKSLGEAMAAFEDAEEARRTAALQATAAAYEQGDEQAMVVAAAEASSAAEARTPQGTSIRKVWQVASINPDLVPCDWRVPDVERIKAHAKATPADTAPVAIPGVTFELKPIVTTRRK